MGAQIVADSNSNNNKCNTHKNLYAHWAEERNGKKGACVCQRRPKGSPLHTPPTSLSTNRPPAQAQGQRQDTAAVAKRWECGRKLKKIRKEKTKTNLSITIFALAFCNWQ